MLSIQNFQIRPLPLIVFGVDSSLTLGTHVLSLQRRSALIVTDRGLTASGIPGALRELLEKDGIAVEVFDGVAPNPTDANVMEGAKLLQQLNDPALVAVGGGSAMDCGKAIALLGPNGGNVEDLQTTPPKHPGVPVIAIATTAGTGSETNSACVITNTRLGRKTYVIHPSIAPKISLLDPKLTLGLPRYSTATCGFDVLTHAVEAFTSNRTTPYSDAVALRAIEMVARYLPRAMEDGSDLEARSQMMLASSMAAIAFNVAGLGAAHGTGHALSARLNIAHGQTLAMMLPHVMSFNSETCAAKYTEMAEVMSAAQTSSSLKKSTINAVDVVVRLRESLGLNKSIRDLGGDEHLLPLLVADAAADPVNRTNPRALDEAAFESLYRAAW